MVDSKEVHTIESTEDLQTFFNLSPDVLCIVGFDGTIKRINPALERTSGFSEEELLFKSHLDFIHPEDRIATIAEIEKITKGKTTVSFQNRYLCKDGSYKRMEWSISPQIEKGVMYVIGRDITERMQAQKRIKHLNLVLHTIRNVSKLISKEKDRVRLLQGTCDNLIKNRGYYNAWIAHLDESGCLVTTAQAGLGDSFMPMIKQLERGELPSCGQRALKQPEIIVNKDVSSSCSDCPLMDKYMDRGGMTIRLEYEGKVYGLLCVSIPVEFISNKKEHSLFKDISEDIAFGLYTLEQEKSRKQAEKSLKEEKEKYQTIFESAGEGILITDIETKKFNYANPAMSKMLGYSIGELEEMSVNNIHPKDELDNLVSEFEAQARGDKILAQNIPCLRKDGTVIYANVNTTNALIDRRKCNIGFFIDVTERKRMDEELRNQRDELEIRSRELAAANQIKSEFLANMSHELRTPLTSIIGFSELLHDMTFGPLNEKQLKYIHNVLVSGKNLLQLVNDILDLTKVEDGKMEIVYEVFKVSTVINEVETLILPIVSNKKIAFSATVDPELNTIQADVGKFKQILFSLISNAIKFSPNGASVTVKAQCIGNMAQIAVIDTGIGISKEDQNKLFQSFVQIDGSISREYGGTGLGLALVKQFVELHSGNVWVKSELGKGSTFVFTLPKEPQHINT